MTKEEAKKWAELFTALAEGKTIERILYHNIDDAEWIEVHSIISTVDVCEYRIKPQPRIRRRTNRELADWIRNCPEEHREWKWKGESLVHSYPKTYDEGEAYMECNEDILIRRNHGEWEEPLIEIEE